MSISIREALTHLMVLRRWNWSGSSMPITANWTLGRDDMLTYKNFSIFQLDLSGEHVVLAVGFEEEELSKALNELRKALKTFHTLKHFLEESLDAN